MMIGAGNAAPRLRRVVIVVLALSATGSCQAPMTEGISREVFVDVYVALREAELRGKEDVITPATRQEVLERFGVGQEDLTDFSRRHGVDVVLMEAIWREIHEEMEALRLLPDSVP